MAIDWVDLATRIGAVDWTGNENPPGTDGGRRALELIIGEDTLREAVDSAVNLIVPWQPGYFTAEAVLKVLVSPLAMQRCYEIYKNEPGTDRGRSVVYLLASMADETALPWVGELLDDPDESIRWNGLAVLQNILYGHLGDDTAVASIALLEKAASIPDARLRERALKILAELKSDPEYSHYFS